jgi:hypothetical protein
MYVRGTDATGPASPGQARKAGKNASRDTAFADLVSRLMGDYPAASKQSLGALIALEKQLAAPQPTWQNGIYAIHTSTLAEMRDSTLKAFTAAASSLLDDYGVDRNVPINLVQDPGGRIRVMNGHPDAEAIEGILNASSLLQDSLGNVMALSYQLYMVDQFNAGNLDPKQAGAVLADLTFELGGSGDPMEGIVRLFGEMLTSSVRQQVQKQDEFAVQKFEEFQQQVEDQHRLDEEHRERVRKEKLAQEAADKRYQYLHPEQKARPVFI